MKAEWRYVLTLHGVLCVMIIGTTQMLLWCVESWDTPLKVTNNHYISTNIFHYNSLTNRCSVLQQCPFWCWQRPNPPIQLYWQREYRLVDCSRVSFNRYRHCRSHFEDAGVRCQGRFLYLSDYSHQSIYDMFLIPV